MHAGSIENNLTAAARVYTTLRKADRWVGGYELQDATRTTALSTRISEVRHQLMMRNPVTEEIEVKQEGKRFYYRLRRVPIKRESGQLVLV